MTNRTKQIPPKYLPSKTVCTEDIVIDPSEEVMKQLKRIEGNNIMIRFFTLDKEKNVYVEAKKECENCIYCNPVDSSCRVKHDVDKAEECDDFDNTPYYDWDCGSGDDN